MSSLIIFQNQDHSNILAAAILKRGLEIFGEKTSTRISQTPINTDDFTKVYWIGFAKLPSTFSQQTEWNKVKDNENHVFFSIDDYQSAEEDIDPFLKEPRSLETMVIKYLRDFAEKGVARDIPLHEYVDHICASNKAAFWSSQFLNPKAEIALVASTWKAVMDSEAYLKNQVNELPYFEYIYSKEQIAKYMEYVKRSRATLIADKTTVINRVEHGQRKKAFITTQEENFWFLKRLIGFTYKDHINIRMTLEGPIVTTTLSKFDPAEVAGKASVQKI